MFRNNRSTRQEAICFVVIILCFLQFEKSSIPVTPFVKIKKSTQMSKGTHFKNLVDVYSIVFLLHRSVQALTSLDMNLL